MSFFVVLALVVQKVHSANYWVEIYLVDNTMIISLQGSKLKRSLGCLLVTNWRNIVTNLYNVNDAAHSLARSVKFDSLKTFQTEVGINFEVNWLCLCDLAHFLWRDQSKITKNVIFTFTLSI